MHSGAQDTTSLAPKKAVTDHRGRIGQGLLAAHGLQPVPRVRCLFLQQLRLLLAGVSYSCNVVFFLTDAAPAAACLFLL
ncbi:hypothetical protein CCHOA_01980 [Corynebacterium choanae]|uniref:Uncharacterized protein n=1 Tax=Corynebacterium choanae TaxID=1862358 RepID=A0A3G6J507_9CORY|nr:hypothetical protein CCHOA_01980 [Corynebacterium choanae]